MSPPPKARPRRRAVQISSSITCLLLLLLVTYHLLTTLHPLAVKTVASVSVAAANSDQNRSHITLWHAPPCRGTWSTVPARDSPGGFPYAVIRDAVVDRRPRARHILSDGKPRGQGRQDEPVRIVLYATTHLSARHTRENSTVSVEGDELVGEVEYVTWVNSMIVPKPRERYRKGMKTRYGAEASAWQIGVRLDAREGTTKEVVDKALRVDAWMNVSLKVVRYDEVEFPLEVSMGMRCVMGWEMPGLNGREESCGEVGDKGRFSEGSILFSGSALYGNKKREPDHFREVANFAARGLLGPLRFDYVAMSVVSDVSVSDMEMKCGIDVECWHRMRKMNEELLTRIQGVVEEELDAIGVPRDLFHRVLLIPTCRLGSDTNGTEKDDPCKTGKRYGQYHATFFSYTILAPYFKWAVSHDMDEYLSAVSRVWHLDSVSAEHALDVADRDMGGHGDMTFQWLNFRLSSLSDSRTLSQRLLRGEVARLRDRDDGSRSSHCYDRRGVSTGKSAVRCDVGLGFTIHHPVTEKVGHGMDINQGDRRSKKMRTWHARLGSASSKCDYEAPKR